MTARVEMQGCLTHDSLGELVAREPAVAVLPAPLGRDHVRRIAGDQVEGLARHRLEQAAEPRLEIVDPVQGGADLREGECARVHVGGDHMIRVRRSQKGVRAVAGADVECPLDATARRQRREPVRRRGEARDPARRIVLAAREAVEGQVDALCGHEPCARHETLAVGDDEAEGRERCDAIASDRRRGVRRGHGPLQQEQADRRRDRRGRETPLEHDGVGEVGGGAVFSQQLLDRLRGVRDGAQRVAESRGSVEVGERVPGVHGRHRA